VATGGLATSLLRSGWAGASLVQYILLVVFSGPGPLLHRVSYVGPSPTCQYSTVEEKNRKT
jgi:hypothetical protein